MQNLCCCWLYETQHEAAGTRFNAAKSKYMVLSAGKGCSTHSECCCTKWISVSCEGEWSRRLTDGLVQQKLYPSAVVNNELSMKAKLWIYWSISIPVLIYDHKLWVGDSKKTRETAEAGFVRVLRMSGLSLGQYSHMPDD